MVDKLKKFVSTNTTKKLVALCLFIPFISMIFLLHYTVHHEMTPADRESLFAPFFDFLNGYGKWLVGLFLTTKWLHDKVEVKLGSGTKADA